MSKDTLEEIKEAVNQTIQVSRIGRATHQTKSD